MGVEEEAQALFQKWQQQQNAMMGNQFGDPGLGTDQSPHLFENNNPSSPDQSPVNPVNSVRPMNGPISPNRPQTAPITPPISSPAMIPQPAQMGGTCSQCGMMHPPLRQGEKCPNASVATATSDNPDALDDATINKHLVDMRNIVMAQITSKGIKNQKKFFQFAIVELTKALEGYNE